LKADTIDLNHLFWTGVRYEVPIFQRPYVWTETDQWEPLWEDISTIAERLLAERVKATPEDRAQGIPERRTPPHFLGAVVLDQMLAPPGEIERRNIVDGQQRLTTLQLLLAAVRDVAAGSGSQEAQLFSKLAENDQVLWKALDDRFKVWPTNADRAAFRLAMLGVAPEPDAEIATRILEAHAYFKKVVADWLTADAYASEAERLSALRIILWSHIKLVSINLEPVDDAQVIFESLNARGTPLLASDLIKNYVFQKATRQNTSIEPLYRHYWEPLDDIYWRKTIRQGRLHRPRLDVFFYHWLTLRSGHDVLVSRLFQTFKETVDKEEPAEKTLDEVDLYTKVFRSFENFPMNSPEELFFYRLDATQTTTATPLLLFVFGLSSEELSLEQRRKMLAAIDSWLIRRMLCRMTTKNYNIVFAQLLADVRAKPGEAGDITVGFLSRQEGESRLWPSDQEVRADVLTLPLYRILSPGRLRIVLEALETKMRIPGYAEETGPPRDLSIEHVMPQSWAAHWPLSPEVDQQLATLERDQLIHTLGNLTLVTHKLNSLQSNAPWDKKAKTLARHTVLMLNKRLLENDPKAWDESSIRARGMALADLIVEIWPAPKRTSEVPSAAQAILEHKVLAPPDGAPVQGPGLVTLRADVKAFLEVRVTIPEHRGRIESFLGEVLKLPDITASVGRSSQTKDGWAYSINVRRKGFGPAFLYVFANRKILFRLAEADASWVAAVDFSDPKAKTPYRVRVTLATDEGYEAALQLAQRAYEKVLP
jgi:hypothetical protein